MWDALWQLVTFGAAPLLPEIHYNDALLTALFSGGIGFMWWSIKKFSKIELKLAKMEAAAQEGRRTLIKKFEKANRKGARLVAEKFEQLLREHRPNG